MLAIRPGDAAAGTVELPPIPPARVRSHYDTLQVPRDASPEVIKAAYRQLMRRHHPDRNPGCEEALRLSKRVNSAYEVLRDPQRRRAHDATLAAAPERTTVVQPGATQTARPRAPVRQADPPAARGIHAWVDLGFLACAILVVAGVLASKVIEPIKTQPLPDPVDDRVEESMPADAEATGYMSVDAEVAG